MYHNGFVIAWRMSWEEEILTSSLQAQHLWLHYSLWETLIFPGYASLAHIAIQSIEPRVLMVEEAGQVLEAHILASLVPSGVSRICLLFWPHWPKYFHDAVHQLICIGDPHQLRPSLATYSVLNIFEWINEKWTSEMFPALSVESAIGNELYKFDRSLMERLSDAQFPMSQINVQRRMRPEISHFIRCIYSSLLLCPCNISSGRFSTQNSRITSAFWNIQLCKECRRTSSFSIIYTKRTVPRTRSQNLIYLK